MNSRMHIVVYGDVHGVGFRFTAIKIARDLGLTGWTRNNEDGSVEIIAEGPKSKLENLATWVKSGPPLAKVEKIKVDWGLVTGEFSAFDVEY